MVIVKEIQSESIKIPNNLTKESDTIYLRNLETKKRYELTFTDENISDNYYVFNQEIDLPAGEYEYEIDGNIGLFRIEDRMGKKEYDEDITFKSYDNTDK